MTENDIAVATICKNPFHCKKNPTIQLWSLSDKKKNHAISEIAKCADF